MQQNAEFRKRIEDALLDGFTPDELARLLKLEMGVTLDHVASGDNQVEVVHALAGWAERQGRLDELLATIHRANPHNRQIEAAYETLAAESTGNESTQPAPRSHRWRWLLPGLGLLLIAGIAIGYLQWPNRSLCDDQSRCLLIAPFSPAGHEDSDAVADQIRLELVDELAGEGATEIAVRQTATVVADRESARELALEEGALLLIWGWIVEDAENGLRVYFELVDRMGVGESALPDPFRAEPILYDELRGDVICTNCFDVSNGELSQQISIIAHAAAGFLAYNEHPERAYHSFLEALYCAGEPVDPAIVRLLQPRCEMTAQPLTWNPGLLTYYAGKSAARSGDYAAGIELLARAAEQNPDDPAAVIGIAAAYRAWTGGASVQADIPEMVLALEEATARIESLIERESHSDDLALLHHNYGLVHELAGRWPQAIEEYDEAIRLFDEKPSAYASLVRQGHALRNDGRYDDAQGVLLRAAELAPGAPWAYLELAQAAWHGHQNASTAQAWLAQAEDAAPDSAAVFEQRALLCNAWGDDACADHAYQQALSLRQGSGLLHLRAGDFYRPSNPVRVYQDWTEANRQYKLALNFRPRDPWLQERLGLVALNSDAPAEAVAFYEKALELTHAESAPARLYCSLATAYERAGQIDSATEARQVCERE